MYVRGHQKKEGYMQNFRTVFFPTPSNDREEPLVHQSRPFRRALFTASMRLSSTYSSLLFALPL